MYIIYIDVYTRHMFFVLHTYLSNQAAADGMMDPLVGRDEEIDRAIQILARRSKCLSSRGAKQDEDEYMGVSLNGGTPKTPQNDHFLVGKLHCCWVPPFWEIPIYIYTHEYLERDADISIDQCST